MIFKVTTFLFHKKEKKILVLNVLQFQQYYKYLYFYDSTIYFYLFNFQFNLNFK
jgi:hypothetical protein